ncbi:MAG: polysaccharide deacetylase family protein [Polyangiaceae bacterium]|nr:polysaccharide deacetylase family protein [Polyangiaceae bacterium]
MVVKIPALVAVVAILTSARGPWAWASAGLVVSVAAFALLWPVFDVNSSVWAPTRSRARHPGPLVALTFDDGPDADFTPRVLEILEAKRVPAAFFVVGEHVRAHPELVERIASAGHVVANHTDRHATWFHFLLWGGARRELAACDAAIHAAIGKVPRLFRSPQGFKNPALGDVLRAMGFVTVGWRVRGLDAIERDADKIVRRIVSATGPGDVVQMHDGSTSFGLRDRRAMLDALPRVIDCLRDVGLEFVRLDRLLDVDPYR